MKSEKNILIAFMLNLAFSVFELVGGAFTNSVAIISDAIHDLGDAMSIGISLVLERISRKKPDYTYTYGYARFSVMGSVITTVILLVGSVAVSVNAVGRIINPAPVNYDGMIIFAVVGAAVNFAAAYFTKEVDSLNQKAVNLHMLEDVLGWVVVLVGAIVMKFTQFAIIDAAISLGVSVFIIVNALRNLKEVLDIFLEKTPKGIDIAEIKKHLLEIDGVTDVHHIHIRSIDGYRNYATMHIVARNFNADIKKAVKEELNEHGIVHSTLEFENEGEDCGSLCCAVSANDERHSHHHHHHHH